jgi:hypothetical protein
MKFGSLAANALATKSRTSDPAIRIKYNSVVNSSPFASVVFVSFASFVVPLFLNGQKGTMKTTKDAKGI